MKDLWVSISGAIAQQRNVETIANNVANANTPGFKRDQTVFKEHLTALERGSANIDLPNKEWAPEDFYRSFGAEKAFVKTDGSYTNFSQGQLSPTGNPLDFGLHGPGFFEVLSPNGIRYTRQGSFTLSSDGKLVTSSGYPILGKIDLPETGPGDELKDVIKQIPDPKDRTITIPPGKLSINLQGEIFVNGNQIGTLEVTEFKDIQALKKEGSSLYINRNAKNISKEDLKTTINQGFMEQSNVNAITEMSKLIKAHRHFESIQKAIKAYDNISGKSVNELARF